MRRLIGDPLAAGGLIFAAWLLGMSFHAANLTPLAWLALAVIGLVVRHVNILPAYVAGVVFQLTGVFWMTQCYSSIALTETRVLNWLLLGTYFGTVFPVIVIGGRKLAIRWPMWLALPVIWTIADLLRYEIGRLLGGPYPWLALGYSQTGFNPICQVADLGGAWAVGFVAAMFGGLLADMVRRKRLPVVPCLLVLAAVTYGYLRTTTISESTGPVVLLVPGGHTDVLAKADVAIWPESAFLNPTAVNAACPTVVGCIRVDKEQTFNSLYITIGENTICYDKCNPVPYSEANITAGNEAISFKLADHRIGVAICYDICFARFMSRLSSCDLVLVAANEAADPTMRLASQLTAMAKVRAIEMRRTIVRNSNGGYSGTIDGNGNLNPVEIDFRVPVTQQVQIDQRFSVYALMGDWLPIACVLMGVIFSVRRRPRLQSVPLISGNVVVHESDGPVAQ